MNTSYLSLDTLGVSDEELMSVLEADHPLTILKGTALRIPAPGHPQYDAVSAGQCLYLAGMSSVWPQGQPSDAQSVLTAYPTRADIQAARVGWEELMRKRAARFPETILDRTTLRIPALGHPRYDAVLAGQCLYHAGMSVVWP